MSYEKVYFELLLLLRSSSLPDWLSKPKQSSTSDTATQNDAPIMKIGTHDGTFHCDEAMACYLLKRLPEFQNAEIVRTRDWDKLQTCKVLVDVGGEYDDERRRYDHHQSDFKETMSSLHPELGNKYTIKLSSAGLIYAHYGERVLETFCQNMHIDLDVMKLIYKKVYENLIQEIDAIDNGVPMYDGLEPNYDIRTHLSARVAKLNPEWNSLDKDRSDEIFEIDAMMIVGEEFEQTVNYYIYVWLPARKFVELAIVGRKRVHYSGSIMELQECVPWKTHLFDLEEEMNLGDEIKFVIFPEKPDSWRVQAVPVAPNSFNTRKPLCQMWWGYRDEELSERSRIKDCIFVHNTGFIGGAKTRESALMMAIGSLMEIEVDH